MPNIKSAKKRVIVNNKRAQRNKSMNSALKTAIKKANVAIESGPRYEAQQGVTRLSLQDKCRRP